MEELRGRLERERLKSSQAADQHIGLGTNFSLKVGSPHIQCAHEAELAVCANMMEVDICEDAIYGQGYERHMLVTRCMHLRKLMGVSCTSCASERRG